jgi:hemolysin activation/secretion protein
VYVRGGVERLQPEVSGDANRYTLDARGYVGLVGQAVLSTRLQYSAADAPLPIYERALLGGADSVRGYRAGFDSGDNMMAVSTELRLPLNSPLGISRAGLGFFGDFGRVWEHGERAKEAAWRRGGGISLFFLASVLQLRGDLAIREGGGARFHFSTGLQF